MQVQKINKFPAYGIGCQIPSGKAIAQLAWDDI